MRKRIMWTLAGVLLKAGVALFAKNREQATETRYSGAYRFEDGTLVDRAVVVAFQVAFDVTQQSHLQGPRVAILADADHAGLLEREHDLAEVRREVPEHRAQAIARAVFPLPYRIDLISSAGFAALNK